MGFPELWNAAGKDVTFWVMALLSLSQDKTMALLGVELDQNPGN